MEVDRFHCSSSPLQDGAPLSSPPDASSFSASPTSSSCADDAVSLRQLHKQLEIVRASKLAAQLRAGQTLRRGAECMQQLQILFDGDREELSRLRTLCASLAREILGEESVPDADALEDDQREETGEEKTHAARLRGDRASRRRATAAGGGGRLPSGGEAKDGGTRPRSYKERVERRREAEATLQESVRSLQETRRCMQSLLRRQRLLDECQALLCEAKDQDKLRLSSSTDEQHPLAVQAPLQCRDAASAGDAWRRRSAASLFLAAAEKLRDFGDVWREEQAREGAPLAELPSLLQPTKTHPPQEARQPHEGPPVEEPASLSADEAHAVLQEGQLKVLARLRETLICLLDARLAFLVHIERRKLRLLQEISTDATPAESPRLPASASAPQRTEGNSDGQKEAAAVQGSEQPSKSGEAFASKAAGARTETKREGDEEDTVWRRRRGAERAGGDVHKEVEDIWKAFEALGILEQRLGSFSRKVQRELLVPLLQATARHARENEGDAAYGAPVFTLLLDEEPDQTNLTVPSLSSAFFYAPVGACDTDAVDCNRMQTSKTVSGETQPEASTDRSTSRALFLTWSWSTSSSSPSSSSSSSSLSSSSPLSSSSSSSPLCSSCVSGRCLGEGILGRLRCFCEAVESLLGLVASLVLVRREWRSLFLRVAFSRSFLDVLLSQSLPSFGVSSKGCSFLHSPRQSPTHPGSQVDLTHHRPSTAPSSLASSSRHLSSSPSASASAASSSFAASLTRSSSASPAGGVDGTAAAAAGRSGLGRESSSDALVAACVTKVLGCLEEMDSPVGLTAAKGDNTNRNRATRHNAESSLDSISVEEACLAASFLFRLEYRISLFHRDSPASFASASSSPHSCSDPDSLSASPSSLSRPEAQKERGEGRAEYASADPLSPPKPSASSPSAAASSGTLSLAASLREPWAVTQFRSAIASRLECLLLSLRSRELLRARTALLLFSSADAKAAQQLLRDLLPENEGGEEASLPTFVPVSDASEVWGLHSLMPCLQNHFAQAGAPSASPSPSSSTSSPSSSSSSPSSSTSSPSSSSSSPLSSSSSAGGGECDVAARERLLRKYEDQIFSRALAENLSAGLLRLAPFQVTAGTHFVISRVLRTLGAAAQSLQTAGVLSAALHAASMRERRASENSQGALGGLPGAGRPTPHGDISGGSLSNPGSVHEGAKGEGSGRSSGNSEKKELEKERPKCLEARAWEDIGLREATRQRLVEIRDLCSLFLAVRCGGAARAKAVSDPAECAALYVDCEYFHQLLLRLPFAFAVFASSPWARCSFCEGVNRDEEKNEKPQTGLEKQTGHTREEDVLSVSPLTSLNEVFALDLSSSVSSFSPNRAAPGCTLAVPPTSSASSLSSCVGTEVPPTGRPSKEEDSAQNARLAGDLRRNVFAEPRSLSCVLIEAMGSIKQTQETTFVEMLKAEQAVYRQCAARLLAPAEGLLVEQGEEEKRGSKWAREEAKRGDLDAIVAGDETEGDESEEENDNDVNSCVGSRKTSFDEAEQRRWRRAGDNGRGQIGTATNEHFLEKNELNLTQAEAFVSEATQRLKQTAKQWLPFLPRQVYVESVALLSDACLKEFSLALCALLLPASSSLGQASTTRVAPPSAPQERTRFVVALISFILAEVKTVFLLHLDTPQSTAPLASSSSLPCLSFSSPSSPSSTSCTSFGSAAAALQGLDAATETPQTTRIESLVEFVETLEAMKAILTPEDDALLQHVWALYGASLRRTLPLEKVERILFSSLCLLALSDPVTASEAMRQHASDFGRMLLQSV
ncbi:hypothetical protein TGGT1_228340 [Toxoplasma gondii GT1]|uniref:Uncharacterized protein n=4 Tax=Toxoplasma gondii TaxID=5811 RepID=S7W611_TOXGG|nr:hypothetical protein TGGT1_228340 [Toxoplasma gondii GT1]KFG52221.1 putative elongation factor Tu GTP-binding domain protein [Toxoplasma gondii FOU]PUA90933.1 putative elongation factor Tu GTP-binding domain protein [Toxoplasma gondii TgCATBr9]RQX74300.1 putative elongation factor Tu GTP-binding domain protein [Toxoplasma gondii CAST]